MRKKITELGVKRLINLVYDIHITFDRDFYRKQYKRRWYQFFPFLHFLFIGIWQKRAPNAFFDQVEFMNKFPTNSYSNRFPFPKYLLASSGSMPFTAFDFHYLKLYPDVSKFQRSIIAHYFQYGREEHRPLSVPHKSINKETLVLWHDIPSLPSTPIVIVINSCAQVIVRESNDRAFSRLKFHQDNQLQIDRHSHPKYLTVVGKYIDCHYLPNESGVRIEIEVHEGIVVTISHLQAFVLRLMSGEFEFERIKHLVKEYLEDCCTKPEETAISYENVFFRGVSLPQHSINMIEIEDRCIPRIENVLCISHDDSISGAPKFISQLNHIFKQSNFNSLLISMAKSRIGSQENRSVLGIDKYWEDLCEEFSRDNIAESSASIFSKSINRLFPGNDAVLIVLNSVKVAHLASDLAPLGKPMILLIHENTGFGSRNINEITQEELRILNGMLACNLVVFSTEESREKWKVHSKSINSTVIPSFKHTVVPERRALNEQRRFLRQELRVNSHDFVYLAIGNFEKRKRSTDIVEAFSALDMDDSHLVLIGLWDKNETYNQKVLELSLGNPRIHIFENQADLSSFYASADAFVLMSEVETFPLVLQESAAYELPRITSKFDGYEKCLGDNHSALTYSVGDVSELAQKMKLLKENRQIRDDLINRARGVLKERDEVIANYPTEILVKLRDSVATRILKSDE